MIQSAVQWLVALLAASLALPALAEQKTEFDGYTVHYSAFPSSQLAPAVAQRYGITRSRAIGLVNISVIPRQGVEGRPRGAEADVSGQMLNDLRQQRSLPFRRIQEGQAVYYLAPFQFQPAELLEFRIQVRPLGQEKTLPLRFTQQFFNDAG